MASNRDILLKYKFAYPKFESESIHRLNELKRSFSNEKNQYQKAMEKLDHSFHEKQENHNQKISELNQSHQDLYQSIDDHYLAIQNNFNEDMFEELKALDQSIDEEHRLFDDILEQFETRKQDALDIYIQLTKKNNDDIDKDMQIHHRFIKKEQAKLDQFKKSYDDQTAQLSNKMVWTIEKSKNAIEQLRDNLSTIDKDDMISLNQQILHTLTDLRGTRNDINALFKETSNHLNQYKENIYKLRKSKQKPYSDINHKLIHKLIKQIRIANDNKNKYQHIIQKDLDQSLNKLYPSILKAHEERRKDDLEKYILQVEILKEKANHLINKIEKITRYNISTYQSRIKEIKVETFTRNEEIRFSYSVPMSYIENAISIYSNYNFYFNQGFNDLDKLLSDLIDFSQAFNDIRDQEVIQVKNDLADYQNHYLAQIKDISDHLSDLLYQIDDIAFQITTLESKHRLEIAEIKKEIVNVDIKGDYTKFLESLNTDYHIAKQEYKNRLKKININKLYKDKTLDFYKKAIQVDLERERVQLDQTYHESLTDLEKEIHKDHYDYLKSQMDTFYHHQANLFDLFMQMMKQRLTQTLKATNYYLAKGYFTRESTTHNRLNQRAHAYKIHQDHIEKAIKINQSESKHFIKYLEKNGKAYSTVTYLEREKYHLKKKLIQTHQEKLSVITKSLIDSYQSKHQVSSTINQELDDQKLIFKRMHLLTEQYQQAIPKLIKHKLYFRNLIHTMTEIVKKANNLCYQYHAHHDIEHINNHYDDFIVKLTEKTIKTLEKAKRKNVKKQKKIINQYLFSIIKNIDHIWAFYQQRLDHAHMAHIKPMIKTIAYAKINLKEDTQLLEKEFTKLQEKALNNHKHIHKQQNMILAYTNKVNHYLDHQIKQQLKILSNDQNSEKKALDFLEKEIAKIIKRNDRMLKEQLKTIHKVMLEDYQTLLNHYDIDIENIQMMKDKVIEDGKIEKLYIDHHSKQQIQAIEQTKSLLSQQVDLIPKEREFRLAEIQNNQEILFKDHQEQLLSKYAQIEKHKFTKVPLLEESIEEKEQQLKQHFINLYQKHKDLEAHYLQQFTKSNQHFLDLHQGFQKDLIQSELAYDQELDQPFKDLVQVESSITDKVDIIQKEVFSKTNQKVSEIKEQKQISQKKQDRIIHS